MRSEPIDLNNVNSGNLASALAQMKNQIPAGAVLLDKTLLPSRGKFYPGDLYVKKLTTMNIKNLATIDEKNIQGIINGVIQSCLFGVDVNKVLVGDKIWLIFYLRSFTYNDIPFKLRGECTKCNTIANYEYCLSNLEVSYLDKDLPDEFEIGEDKISIKFPTIQTEADTVKLKTNDQIVEEIASDLLDLSTYVYKVNGKELSLMQAYKYICNMDAFSFSKLTNILTDYVFTAKPYAKFKCPVCGEDINLPISFIPQFFLPKV